MSMRQIILLVKHAPTSASFYVSTLGLKIIHETSELIQLNTGSNSLSLPIILKQSSNVSQMIMGYSPILCFDVKNMDNTLSKALELGAILDGPIKYPLHGKFASIRTPDGNMIGLFEPTDI